jgi:hypothetical protein
VGCMAGSNEAKLNTPTTIGALRLALQAVEPPADPTTRQRREAAPSGDDCDVSDAAALDGGF